MYFIFEVKVRDGHEARQYADAWVRVSEIIQRAPGARGTRLHRMIGDPTRLIAIASWDSKESRDAAEPLWRDNEAAREILREAASHAEVTVIGEFDDPAWIVDRSQHTATDIDGGRCSATEERSDEGSGV